MGLLITIVTILVVIAFAIILIVVLSIYGRLWIEAYSCGAEVSMQEIGRAHV